MTVEREMPKYQCHKQVWALKIKEVKVASDGTAVITPADAGFGDFDVESSYIDKHSPQAGGYYVQYAGGYESYSPADAFEGGYSLIQTETPIATLFDFYEVSNLNDLVRELVLHVAQLQEAAQRNVKPWEDTFPPTLLPAYIQRIKDADAAAS